MAGIATKKLSRYGLLWDASLTDLEIELQCIQLGGQWTQQGRKVGLGAFHHYKAAMTLLWPEDDWHRWAELALRTIVQNDIAVFLGASDTNKTYLMSKFALVDWWAFPDETLWMISSTTIKEAERRIWGTIKTLFNKAKDRWGDDLLPGTVLEGANAITTDSISKDHKRARTLQRGLVLVPCKRGSDFVGLGAYIGVKAPRLGHVGDEVALMHRSFLDAYANWYGKRHFKGIMAANPMQYTDPSCIAAEPLGGWDAWTDTGKTQTWRSKFYDAAVVAFDGRDSPNFDYPPELPVKYHYLIGRKKIEATAKTFGTNSWQYWTWCIGKPNANLTSWQVITRQLCDEHGARKRAEWLDGKHTLIYGLDPNYGGEDRCVGGYIEFGMGLDGKEIVKFYKPELIQVSVTKGSLSPEDQIAQHVKKRLDELGIPPKNCFYDATGKGTLGGAFARVFGYESPIPIDSGGVTTMRPVRYDLFIDDGKGKRLKTCREHYSKFVTEMWFSVREVIEGDQMRELPEDVMDELSARLYKIVKGNKIEVEPKDDLKERIRCSPDLADFAALSIEGARQRGFRICRLGLDAAAESETDNPWTEQETEWDGAIKSALLTRL